MQQPHAHLPRPAHKEPPAHAPNAALLIDFDNVTMGIRSDLQSELRRLLQSEIIRGKVAVQRAYADWRRYPQYIVPLSESSIDLIFAPAYGSNKKNATDIRLAIDALELVFTRPEIGTFILLSGDSDFSSLVLKLKEYGKYVIGVGIRESSSDLLIQNCDEYYSYNELAGFQKESDIVHQRWDAWELVVEAVKQMTAHNDVMRSDRLKQVMQEIDPGFDEKDAGFSRFTKFVQEASRRGLIGLTRRDNGQFEISLGGNTGEPAAQPGGGPPADEPPAREPSPRRGSLVGEAFGFLKSALGPSHDGEAGMAPAAPARDEVGDQAETAPAAAAAAAAAPTPTHEEEDEPPMPLSSAPPPPYSTHPTAGGVPARSARFRRGSKGGPRAGAPGVPRVGVVEGDSGSRSATSTPARGPDGGSGDSAGRGEGGERRERGERSRGGRGGGRGRGGPRTGDRPEGSTAERQDRGGRSRRGGRGRGPRNDERREGGEPSYRHSTEAPRQDSVAAAPPPPPPAPRPAPEADTSGESFWTRVKRGLTGGT